MLIILSKYLLFFLISFTLFSILRILHWRIVKDVYKKYIIYDSLFYSWFYLGLILYWDYYESIYDYWNSALFFLIYFVIIPIIYTTCKWYFILDHPKLKSIYYPLIELAIYIFWSVSVWLITEFIASYLFK